MDAFLIDKRNTCFAYVQFTKHHDQHINERVLTSLDGESLRELVQPGAGADHHRVVCLLHHLVHRALKHKCHYK